MDEQEFRASLHHAIDRSTAPPSMSTTGAVHAGRRAARRRLLATGAAGIGVLALVTTIGLAVATGGSGAPQQVGAPGVASTPPRGDETKPVWPTGPDGQPQQDRTAKAGVKADAAKALLEHLVTVAPAGYTVPDEPAIGTAPPSRSNQAQFEDKVGGKDAWSYQASAQIRKDGATGQLIVEVHEPGLISGGACELAKHFWTEPGGCTVVPVGGRDVAVATAGDPGDSRIDRWAAYGYPDGTVVFVAVSRHANFMPDSADRPLSTPPLTDQQLAALAVDEAFHIRA